MNGLSFGGLTAAEAGGAVLNNQERQVVMFLIQGFKDGEIAAKTSVDVHMIRRSFRTIQRKLGVTDRLELVLYALNRKILSAPPRSIQQVAPTRKYRRPAPAV